MLRKLGIGGSSVALALALWVPLAVSVAGGLGLYASTAAQAQDARVREIQVVGNRRVEPETVRSYMRVTVGDAYSEARVNQSITALFATGLFADVRIERNGGTVVVTVTENPVIGQVAFEGNREVEKTALEAEVQLKPRSVFTRAKVQADVQRILDVYRRQGRFTATVEPKIIELEHGRVNLVFEINEGGATKVKSIQFVGNHAFSDAQLRDIVTTTQQGWFDFIKGTAFYDPDRLNLDRELLRQYYLKNGHADVRIVAADVQLDRDGSGFFVTYVVEEGEPYVFGDIQVESKIPGVDVAELKGLVITHPGETFNASEIDKSVEALTLALTERGYTFGRVRPRADRDSIGRVIKLTFVIDEGPRIYIERINIIGNLRTRDYVIRREFRVAEGDAYNPLLVDTAKKRLTALGLFKGVDIKRRPGSAEDRVVLDVTVVEQPTGEISFGAGYSTQEGVIGDIGFTERNFMGKGQFLRLKLGGSLERMQVDLSFTEPRFLDRNLSAGFDLFYRLTQKSDYQPYDQTHAGGSLRLGMPLSEHLWLTTNYTLSYDEMSNVDFDNSDGRIASRAIRDLLPKDGLGNITGTSFDYWTSSIGTSLTYDRRNHTKTPTSGYYLNGGVDFAGVGGDVQYVRLQGEGRFYYPITEKITFVGRVAGGHILGWGGDEVRLLDMFYKGGETIRGFDRLGYGARDLATQDSLGGSTYYVGTAEVRFPLPLVPDEIGLSGAVFVDAGSLFGVSNSVKALNGTLDPVTGLVTNINDGGGLRVSAGFGILWNSPLGPLRADLGWALIKEDFDKEQVFRFGASTRF
ncbi:MAG: outer membrane protein assembly factor BamA [Hyphomicrobiaceae bacterium]